MKIAHDSKKPALSAMSVVTMLLSVAALVVATWTGNRAGESEHTGASEPLAVEGAWARPALAGGNTAVYMKLTNNGSQSLRLTGAASGVAAAAELHETTMTPEFVMQMRPVQSVEIPPGQTVEFSPGGLHVMLFGLNRALNEGDQFTLELVVEGLDEPVPVRVPVQHSGDGAGHGDHAGHDDHATAAVQADHAAHDDHAAHEDHSVALHEHDAAAGPCPDDAQHVAHDAHGSPGDAPRTRAASMGDGAFDTCSPE